MARGLTDQFGRLAASSTQAPSALAVYAGVFVVDVSSVDDSAMVSVPSMTVDGADGSVFTARCWMPRVDDSAALVYPSAGDPAWVQFDDSNDPIVVAWRPA